MQNFWSCVFHAQVLALVLPQASQLQCQVTERPEFLDGARTTPMNAQIMITTSSPVLLR